MIETDTEMIDAAADFGFKVYYGDGTRLDILHAAGAAEAGVILVCVDDREAAVRIVELCKAEFPLVPVLARAFDRQEALRLAARRAWTGRSARPSHSSLALGRGDAAHPRGARGGGGGDHGRGAQPRRRCASSASSSAASPRRGTSSAATSGLERRSVASLVSRTWVALLYSIVLGRRRRVVMADLRALAAEPRVRARRARCSPAGT